ncbi:hypothetical protein V6R21_09150 [Limibacter armeniacum]|uniref:hypothetical protein n=1 Tax=Limibacter armeniacum TaxID=466084 RepID=UPI002FE62CF1
MSNAKNSLCEMCGREKELTFHHLIPRTNHKNKWFIKNFDKDDMRNRGAYLCRPCHSHIHKTFSEKELGRHFNTLESIMADERMQKFVRWIKKQK